MKTLLVLAVLLLIPEGAMAARWDGQRLIVYDHSAPQWRPIVEQKVVEWAQAMPRGGPRVSYRAAEQTECDRTPRRTGAIVVCSRDDPAYPGTTIITPQGGRILWAKVILSDAWFSATPENTVCQELGHAILDMQDRDSYTDAQSCVWGELSSPGPVDVAYAQRVYSHDSGPRLGHGGKHHRAKRRRA